ncbi:DNA replication complex GINS protein Psf2p [Trichomonascus vanleenenianus]|uniref:DNA replication protein PSF2 n=1 Tax=Trichomonascus vanleenenianus TaxID=2268995 RepID=UPI003ECA4189
MATPAKLQKTFSPAEVFFMAEATDVTVIPRQPLEKLELIGCEIPKLQPMRHAVLPLWLALLLKKQGRVRIVQPDWLQESQLKKVYDEEVQNSDRFSPLPWHWMEVGEAILSDAADDLSTPAYTIRNLLRDIREIRQSKARAGVSMLNENHMQMDNMGMMEINELRPFIAGVMDEMRKITDLIQDEQDEQMDEDDDY